MEYQVDRAVGRHIVVEPLNKSTVLQAEETATIFKILFVPNRIDAIPDFGKEPTEVDVWDAIKFLNEEDLIIVALNSVELTMMGSQKVYFVRDTDIIAIVKVKNGHSSNP